VFKEFEKMMSLKNFYDILKIILNDKNSNYLLEEMRHKVNGEIPSIMIKMGPAGKMSRVSNKFLTPVYSKRFGQPTGTGQMTKTEIILGRRELGLLTRAKKFYLFGKEISMSPSPEIYNNAF